VLTTRFLFFNQVVAVRQELLEQIGCFREDLQLNEDYELALRLSLMGRWAFVADPLVIWHEHTDNLSRNYRYRQLEVCQSVFQILNELKNAAAVWPFFAKAVATAAHAGLEKTNLRFAPVGPVKCTRRVAWQIPAALSSGIRGAIPASAIRNSHAHAPIVILKDCSVHEIGRSVPKWAS